MSIIDKLPKLEVIRTEWNSFNGRDSIAGVMTTKTQLKKIIFTLLTEQHYNALRAIIDSEWQIEGNVQELIEEATFIRKENDL